MKTLCKICSKPLHPDEEGLSQKLLGRDITEFFCIECLAKYIGSTPENLKTMMERFRDEGCQLFTPREYL